MHTENREEHTQPNRLQHTSQITRLNRIVRRGPAYPQAPSAKPGPTPQSKLSQFLYRLYLWISFFTIAVLIIGIISIGSQVSLRLEERAETLTLSLPEQLASAQPIEVPISQNQSPIPDQPTAIPAGEDGSNQVVAVPQGESSESEAHVTALASDNHSENMDGNMSVETESEVGENGDDQPLILADQDSPTVEEASPVPLISAELPQQTPIAAEETIVEEGQEAVPIPASIIEIEEVGPIAEPPLRLIIPEIEVNHEIIDVPIVRGRWDVSDLGDQVGQLEGTGRHPGDEMSMTLVAHATTNWPAWGPFQRLNHLPLGATVEVETESTRYQYAIVRFVYVDPTSARAAFQQDGNQLILITCGNYDFLQGQYQDRLVAYAELISSRPISGS